METGLSFIASKHLSSKKNLWRRRLLGGISANDVKRCVGGEKDDQKKSDNWESLTLYSITFCLPVPVSSNKLFSHYLSSIYLSSVYLFVNQFTDLGICVSICLPIDLFIDLPCYVCVGFNLFLNITIFYLPRCVKIYMYVCLYFCLFLHPAMYQYRYALLFICPSSYVSICLYVLYLKQELADP